MIALWSSMAAARPLVVVVAANVQWASCPDGQGGDRCPVPERELVHTHDDAQRAAFLLTGLAPREDVLVFTQTPSLRWAWSAAPLRAGAARLDAVVDTVRCHTKSWDESADLTVYVSSHGTVDGLHLEDGVVPRSQLLSEIEAAAGGEVSLFIADACDTGSQGQAKGPVLTRVSSVWERPGPTAVVVLDEAYEAPTLAGGVLSWLVRSGLVGGADLSGDGEVSAWELSDFLHSYDGSFTRPFAYEVRAPSRHATVLEWDPARATVVPLVPPEAREDWAWRWLIEASDGGESLSCTVEGACPPAVVADVFSDNTVDVRMPPSTYLVHAVPYSRGAAEAMPMPIRESNGFRAWRCALDPRGALACGDVVSLPSLAALQPELPTRKGAVGTVVGAHGGAIPRRSRVPAGRLSRHNHRLSGRGHRVSVGARLSPPYFGRAGAVPIGVVGWAWTPSANGDAIRGHLGVGYELGDAPSAATHFIVDGAFDAALLTSLRWRVGIDLGAGVGALLLTAPAPLAARQASGLVGPDLGPSWTWLGDRSRHRLAAVWTPRLVWVDDEGGRGRFAEELARADLRWTVSWGIWRGR